MATPLTNNEVSLWEGNDPVAKELSLGTLLNTVISELSDASVYLSALGLSGKKIVAGNSAFVTSGTTKTIDVSALSSIDSAIVTPHVDQVGYSVTNTISGGNLTVTRPGGGTSAATFSYIVIGDPA